MPGADRPTSYDVAAIEVVDSQPAHELRLEAEAVRPRTGRSAMHVEGVALLRGGDRVERRRGAAGVIAQHADAADVLGGDRRRLRRPAIEPAGDVAPQHDVALAGLELRDPASGSTARARAAAGARRTRADRCRGRPGWRPGRCREAVVLVGRERQQRLAAARRDAAAARRLRAPARSRLYPYSIAQ